MLAQHPHYPEVPPQLSELFAEEGLSLLGIAECSGDAQAAARYQRWIDSGHAAQMHYLMRHAPLKYSPQQLLQGCRSILMAGMNYYRRSAAEPGQPRVARYAWGRDYHLVLGKRLRRLARRLGQRYGDQQFSSFTDATPLDERFFGERAGVGFSGRNTLLISGQYGSWFLLGGILSTQHFPATPAPQGSHGACPRSCTRCIDVCPTGALLGPNRIDASRCISYLTIELRGSIPAQLRPAIGNWLFGCDLCQEVCPLNLRAQVTSEPDFLHDRAGESPDLSGILAIETDQQFAGRFAGNPLMRARRQGLVRNACVVAANTRRHDLKPLLQRRSADSDAVIAEHARWALAVLAADETEFASE